MTHLKSFARTTFATLRFLALVSAPIAAVFGSLAWHEAHVARHEAAATAQAELEQRERDLEIQKRSLEAILALLPETEKTRGGIERLVALTTQRIAAVRRTRHKLRTTPQPETGKMAAKPAAPVVRGWWNRYGPASAASRKADEIMAMTEPPN